MEPVKNSIKNEDIVEDGKSGLLYAYDGSILVYAADAATGKEYECPLCHCRMHLSHTKKGRPIFVRYAGQKHSDPVCSLNETSRKKYSFANDDPIDFIHKLCRKAIPRGKKMDDPDDNWRQPDKDNDDDDEEFTVKKYSSLKQILEDKIWMYKPNDVIGNGNRKAGEVLLTHRWGLQVINGHRQNLGSKMIHCNFDRFIFSENMLQFSMYDKAANYTVKFVLMAIERTIYQSAIKKFAKNIEENGKTRFAIIARESLVAGDDWVLLPVERCKHLCSNEECGNCVGMYMDNLINLKQIACLKNPR